MRKEQRRTPPRSGAAGDNRKSGRESLNESRDDEDDQDDEDDDDDDDDDDPSIH